MIKIENINVDKYKENYLNGLIINLINSKNKVEKLHYKRINMKINKYNYLYQKNCRIILKMRLRALGLKKYMMKDDNKCIYGSIEDIDHVIWWAFNLQ